MIQSSDPLVIQHEISKPLIRKPYTRSAIRVNDLVVVPSGRRVGSEDPRLGDSCESDGQNFSLWDTFVTSYKNTKTSRFTQHHSPSFPVSSSLVKNSHENLPSRAHVFDHAPISAAILVLSCLWSQVISVTFISICFALLPSDLSSNL